MNILDRSALLQILQNDSINWTIEETVFACQKLMFYELASLDSTKARLLFEAHQDRLSFEALVEVAQKRFGLENARTLASVDLFGNATDWTHAYEISELEAMGVTPDGE